MDEKDTSTAGDTGTEFPPAPKTLPPPAQLPVDPPPPAEQPKLVDASGDLDAARKAVEGLKDLQVVDPPPPAELPKGSFYSGLYVPSLAEYTAAGYAAEGYEKFVVERKAEADKMAEQPAAVLDGEHTVEADVVVEGPGAERALLGALMADGRAKMLKEVTAALGDPAHEHYEDAWKLVGSDVALHARCCVHVDSDVNLKPGDPIPAFVDRASLASLLKQGALEVRFKED